MKRSFDLTFASLGLVILSPFFLIIALAVKLDSPGPVFFRQERVGKTEVTFRIFKFRSMFVDADKSGPLETTRWIANRAHPLAASNRTGADRSSRERHQAFESRHSIQWAAVLLPRIFHSLTATF